MVAIVLIGLGAGAATALLFASVTTGSILATFLFYLAPLPILIAGLGWSHWAALVAGVSAAAGLGTILGFYLFTAFLFGIALPAWWLGYLSLLARPAASGQAGALDWYPVGRLVLWAAVIGAALVIIAIPNLGADKESFQAVLRTAIERAIGLQLPTPAGTPNPLDRVDTERLINIMVSVIAPAAAVFATLINVVNLWLAGRIVKMSGRLARPWPDLAALTLPAFAPGLAAAAIAGSFLPDIAGVLSGILAASLLTAFAILGFAVLHAITRGVNHRGLVLGGAYGAVVMFVWPVLAVSLLGLAEAAFNFRHRVASKRGPPSLRT
jgi:hypothetical protein